MEKQVIIDVKAVGNYAEDEFRTALRDALAEMGDSQEPLTCTVTFTTSVAEPVGVADVPSDPAPAEETPAEETTEVVSK